MHSRLLSVAQRAGVGDGLVGVVHRSLLLLAFRDPLRRHPPLEGEGRRAKRGGVGWKVRAPIEDHRHPGSHSLARCFADPPPPGEGGHSRWRWRWSARVIASLIFLPRFGQIGLCSRRDAPEMCEGRWSAGRRNQLRAHEARRAPWSGAHASRRSTAAMALVSLETITGSGPRFAGGICALRQRAPRGRLIVARRAEPRSRPGAWLRTTPAGAASRSIRRTPPDGAPQRTGCGKDGLCS